MPRRTGGGKSAIALLLLANAYTYHFLYWNFDDTYILFRVVRNLLSGHGWAFNAGEAHNASTSVLNTWRWPMRATRVARPDVAAVFKQPRFEMSGYTLQGSIVGLPPGDYRVSILQKRGTGFVSCDTAGAITIT